MFWKRHLIPLIFFFLLACITMYAPLFHADTSLPGISTQTDYFHFHWSYWWINHAIQTPGLEVYNTDYVLFPFDNNLAYHTMSPIWFPVWGAITPIFGNIWAMNTIEIIALTLTGYSLYLLMRSEKIPSGLALLGGMVYQLTPAIYLAVFMTTIHYLGFFWLPTQLLIWKQVVRHAETRWKGWLWGLAQGLAFYAMLLTDYQYFLYSLFLLLPYGILTLVNAQRWSVRFRLVSLGSVALTVLLVLGWFAGPLSYIAAFDRDKLSPPTPAGAYSIPFPEGYISRLTYLDNEITLGAFWLFLLLGTLLASLWLRPRSHAGYRWFWLVLAAVMLALSAGDSIQVAGRTIDMPYHWLHTLMGSIYRSPGRFGTAAIVPLMLFIGHTWRDLPRRSYGTLVPALVFLLLVEARFFAPMPLQPKPFPYSFYEEMGQEDEPYLVIEVPTGAGSGETWIGELRSLALQYYAITHHKPIINGLIGRIEISHFWYLRTDDPLLSWLGQRRWLDVDLVRNELVELIDVWHIGYIVIHGDLLGGDGNTEQEIIGFFNANRDLLCPVWIEGDATVYRTSWHPAGCPDRIPPENQPGVYQIDIGSPEDRSFLGWGWYWPEIIAGITVRWTGDWAQLIGGIERWQPGEHNQAQIFVDVPPGAYDVSIEAQAFDHKRELALVVNGQPVGQAVVSQDQLTPLTFFVSAEVIGDGQQVEMRLLYGSPSAPPGLEHDPQARRIALMIDRVELKLHP